MNRHRFAKIADFFFSLHYRVHIVGKDLLYDGRTHLVLPNHPSFIDPLLLFASCWDVVLCPMVDERFFHNRFFAYVLRMMQAVQVPDLSKSRAQQSVDQVRDLRAIALQSLQDGKDVIFYPSGHVALEPKEVIGNRRLAYEVCRDLPQGVSIILVRTTGMYDSHFSKLRPSRFAFRRHVYMECVDMTDQLTDWAHTLDRRTFNQRLESFYNQTT